MKYLLRTALAGGALVFALALASAAWIEYSARNSCASVGVPSFPAQTPGGASATLVDRILPEYQIGEKHSVIVVAPSARAFESLKEAKSDAQPIIKLFNLLPVLAGKSDNSSPSEKKSLYEKLQDSSGLVLEEPNRELVAANIATADKHIPSTPETVRGFVAYRLRHNEMKLPVSFHAEPVESGVRLTTETRIMFADRKLCRDFAWYWGVIYPGSSLLRVDFLDAVKRRAEHGMAPIPEDQKEVPETATDGGTQ